MSADELMGNLAFTLYEVFGYIFPGGAVFSGFLILYWALFLPQVPLSITMSRLSYLTIAWVVVLSYVLGHAAQATANGFFGGAEKAALDSEIGTAPAWMRDRARRLASDLARANPADLDSRWIFRTLDEYALQFGKSGDREIFVYREGFYRGMSLALFFLSAALLVRMCIPGSSIRFTTWLFPVSWQQLLLTAIISGGVATLFVRRYRRFAEYRITRAVLSAIVMHNPSSNAGRPDDESTITAKTG